MRREIRLKMKKLGLSKTQRNGFFGGVSLKFLYNLIFKPHKINMSEVMLREDADQFVSLINMI